MKKSFLLKLKKEEKLQLVEPSEEICESYIVKASDCLTSAKLLQENGLYENSITLSYYAMYNALTSLLSKTGIKSENHTASITLLKIIFDKEGLHNTIIQAKEERIDKQYYVTTEEGSPNLEEAEKLTKSAEKFLLQIQLLLKEINNIEITQIRQKFESQTNSP